MAHSARALGPALWWAQRSHEMQFESLISFGPKYFIKMMIHSEKMWFKTVIFCSKVLSKCRKFQRPKFQKRGLCRHICKLGPATSSVPYGLVLLNWALGSLIYQTVWFQTNRISCSMTYPPLYCNSQSLVINDREGRENVNMSILSNFYTCASVHKLLWV